MSKNNNVFTLIKKYSIGTSLDQGTKIPHATWHSQKKKLY